MKILYIVPIDLDTPEYLGVAKKIRGQIDAFVHLGACVDLVFLRDSQVNMKSSNENEKVVTNVVSRVSKTKPLYDWIRERDVTDQYDFVYIRYANENISLIRMLAHLKKRNIPIYLEYATFPILNEKLFYYRRNTIHRRGCIRFIEPYIHDFNDCIIEIYFQRSIF